MTPEGSHVEHVSGRKFANEWNKAKSTRGAMVLTHIEIASTMAHMSAEQFKQDRKQFLETM